MSTTTVIRGAATGTQRGQGGGGSSWRGRGGTSQRADNQRVGGAPRPSHFISLPLDRHADLRTKVSDLTSYLTSVTPAIEGLESRIFISPARLHMTLGVMTLANPSTSAAAQNDGNDQKTIPDALALLRSLRPSIMDLLNVDDNPGGTLSVPLRGLDIMGRGPKNWKNPRQAHCMWTGPGDKVDESALWKVSLFIHERFKEEGFITETRPLKLHCTIINTSFRKPQAPFSYTSVLSALRTRPDLVGEGSGEFVDESTADFGTWTVDEIQLCRMGSFDSQGRYVSLGGISLKE